MALQGADFDWSRPLGGVSSTMQAIEERGSAAKGQGAQEEESSPAVTLRNIALQVQKGELLAICGEVRHI